MLFLSSQHAIETHNDIDGTFRPSVEGIELACSRWNRPIVTVTKFPSKIKSNVDVGAIIANTFPTNNATGDSKVEKLGGALATRRR